MSPVCGIFLSASSFVSVYFVFCFSFIFNIQEENKFQYIDDLYLLELIFVTDLLLQYDFRSHVASDIGLDQRFLPPSSTKTQTYNEGIAQHCTVPL